jgi:predicted Zn-dependent protease with MMP-like domain
MDLIILSSKTQEELLAQIRVTLLHEIGHLRGEDDDELAARGLE